MRRLPVILLLPLVAGCLSGGGPIIRVVNADSVTLDRVMLEAGGSEYALGRLLPGTAGQVRPAPAPDSSVAVRHHAGGPFAVAAPFAARPKVVEIRLLADSIGGVRVETR
jgi:hypothetical protein